MAPTTSMEWDISRVTDMKTMFSRADLFNGDLSKWVVSNVNDINGMFLAATLFNGDISKWDVSNVHDMSHMFSYIYRHV